MLIDTGYYDTISPADLSDHWEWVCFTFMFVFVLFSTHSTMLDIEWVKRTYFNENVSTTIYL